MITNSRIIASPMICDIALYLYAIANVVLGYNFQHHHRHRVKPRKQSEKCFVQCSLFARPVFTLWHNVHICFHICFIYARDVKIVNIRNSMRVNSIKIMRSTLVVLPLALSLIDFFLNHMQWPVSIVFVHGFSLLKMIFSQKNKWKCNFFKSNCRNLMLTGNTRKVWIQNFAIGYAFDCKIRDSHHKWSVG